MHPGHLSDLMMTSPTQARTLPLVAHTFETPLGPMQACASLQGLCLLEFTDTARLDHEREDLCRLLRTRIEPGQNTHTMQAEQEIAEYFAGSRQHFDVTLHAPGTAFQQGVWSILQRIPYGRTISYQHEAKALGNPRAIRAVATANGANRISIIIPCHRVIGKDGRLVGYGGGLSRKQWLIAHEQAHRPFNLQGDAEEDLIAG